MKTYFVCFCFCITVKSSIAQCLNWDSVNVLIGNDLKDDTMETQTDLTEAACKESDKFDSIVNSKYNCIITFLEKEIQSKVDTDYINRYKEMKEAIESSQKDWVKLKQDNSAMYETFYSGGSERLMDECISQVIDANDRINRLNDFIETLSQDEALNCK